MPVMTELSKIEKALGSKSAYYLEHKSKGIPKEHLHLPGRLVDRIGMSLTVHAYYSLANTFNMAV
jgi:hypothetical protein